MYDRFPLTFYRFTLVKRSYHVGGTIVPQGWNDRTTAVKR